MRNQLTSRINFELFFGLFCPAIVLVMGILGPELGHASDSDSPEPVAVGKMCDQLATVKQSIGNRMNELNSTLAKQQQQVNPDGKSYYGNLLQGCSVAMQVAVKCCLEPSKENCEMVEPDTGQKRNPFVFATSNKRAKAIARLNERQKAKLERAQSAVATRQLGLINMLENGMALSEQKAFACAETQSACLLACGKTTQSRVQDPIAGDIRSTCEESLTNVWSCHKKAANDSFERAAAEAKIIDTELVSSGGTNLVSAGEITCSRLKGFENIPQVLTKNGYHRWASQEYYNELLACDYTAQTHKSEDRTIASMAQFSSDPNQKTSYADKLMDHLKSAKRNNCWRGVWNTLEATGCVRGDLEKRFAKDSWVDLQNQGFRNDMSRCNSPGVVRVYGNALPGVPRISPGDKYGHVEIMLPDGRFQHFVTTRSQVPINERLGNDRRPLTHCLVKDTCE